jgi:hypothetical protein
MHIENANQFFEALAARGREPRLGNATGTWEFDVDGAGTWTIKADEGTLSVTRGRPAENPTARLELSEAELVRLAGGESHENPLTGLLRGAVHVTGDLAFAQRLLSFMPLPADWKAAQ